jgi:parvulin-like peptidyl-prolyl isomerase
MIAKERGRRLTGVLLALTALGVLESHPSQAQLFGARPSAAAKAKAAKSQTAQGDAPGQAQTNPQEVPTLQLTAIPVNPSDAIATVNNEPITRRELADECVARKGKEILDTLIARRLIEQALKKKKLEVTAGEIDQEIDNIAMRMAGIGREAWLRTLDKERGISPVQYARDIIYPALALRKLASGRVQVTEKDMTNAFEAQYGEKLRVRMIMVDKLPAAREIWEELRKNPGGFEKLAQDRSMDAGSRSLGGLLGEPITRHAYPQTVSDAAFRQLVDGDPTDKDPTHKPKDGDVTGPIQVAEATWVVLRREGVIPAQKANPKDERVRKQTYEVIYEVKLKEAMGEYFVELMKGSAIDNKLTGQVKLANEEKEYPVDGEVKLMGNQNPKTAADRNLPESTSSGTGAKTKLPPPVAASPEVIEQGERLTQPSLNKN